MGRKENGESMIYFIVSTVAFVASLLTFFSGFGLGTLLMPVFALFFPLPLAVGMTAIVHLMNNIFKVIFLGKYFDQNVVIRFGLPAVLFAFLGATALSWLSHFKPLLIYSLGGRTFEITGIKIVLAVLMTGFGLLEMLPRFKNLSFDQRYLPLGGILSGFFGGLSGHQGALRSTFLMRCGLSKESFLGTGVVIACFVDIVRLWVYNAGFQSAQIHAQSALIITATVSAFIGVWVGRRFVEKITLQGIRFFVLVFFFLIAVGLASGLI